MWLKTQSWFPSVVKSLIPHPRTSLTVSLEPLSPPTVEILTKAGVLVPTFERKAAEVRSEISWVTSKNPRAPAACACTTLFAVSGWG
jgi:hypothetical protein